MAGHCLLIRASEKADIRVQFHRTADSTVNVENQRISNYGCPYVPMKELSR